MVNKKLGGILFWIQSTREVRKGFYGFLVAMGKPPGPPKDPDFSSLPLTQKKGVLWGSRHPTEGACLYFSATAGFWLSCSPPGTSSGAFLMGLFEFGKLNIQKQTHGRFLHLVVQEFGYRTQMRRCADSSRRPRSPPKIDSILCTSIFVPALRLMTGASNALMGALQ